MSAVIKLVQEHLPADIRKSSFSLEIEPGHEEMWLTLRELPRTGFTAQNLAAATGSNLGRCEFYLAQLVRQGIAEKRVSTSSETIYQVPRFKNEPQVFDDQGRPDADYRMRALLWQTLRQHGSMSVTSLHEFASQHIDVTRQKVAKFMKRLEAAGFVIDISDTTDPNCYRLRPAMNKGPIPPRFCEAELIYDVNIHAFFGKGLAHEVKL